MRSLDFTRLKALPSTCLTFIYLSTLLPSHHALAANQDTIKREDHNHPLILDLTGGFDLGGDVGNYESEFLGLDRSIIGRATTDQVLGNNVPGSLNIQQGDSNGQFWTFPNVTLFGPQTPQTPGLPSVLAGQYIVPTPNSSDERILYISLTTCDQPSPKDPESNGAPSQLELYVSTSAGNKEPDQNNNDFAVPVDGGFGWLNISVKSDVYFGIFAPDNDEYTGIYNYRLTASIDAFYASKFGARNVVFADSDAKSALLYTNNLTYPTNAIEIAEASQWMNNSTKFSIYVQNQDNPSINGLQNSVCGLKNHAQIQGPNVVSASMKMVGTSQLQAMQQFYVQNLNRSSAYYAIVTIDGNSTISKDGVVGGGGIVWNFEDSTTNFITKSDGNCALIYDLPFCSQVAYAVPFNPTNQTLKNTTALGLYYDNYASNNYVNFSRSLQQIACDTTDSAQYSLARNCGDCDAAYRQWLCAVSIPRCEDFSSPNAWLQPRAVNYPFINPTFGDTMIANNSLTFSNQNRTRTYFNSSRNLNIDTDITPGPYKELLPCKDLCYELVRSCPASLQFVCPTEGHGLNYSYGNPPEGANNTNVTCNAPGMVLNGTSALRMFWGMAVAMALGVSLLVTAL